jgi:GTP 3',8-cyclase
MSEAPLWRDSRGRTLRALRVSVTDRCNLRCLYCLPEIEPKTWRGMGNQSPRAAHLLPPPLARSELLSFEEITRVARLATALGIHQIRLSGGEPLLRREIESLVHNLAQLPGLRDLAMTTNGLAFAEKAKALRDAGLQRITFSLDSLDRANYQKITGQDGLERVLAAITRAQELGFAPVKINTVVIRNLNDHEIEALAALAHARHLSVRFIEFMPLDSARGWRPELVVTGQEILERLQACYHLQPVPGGHISATAQRWKFPDQQGEIGLITPISEPFCNTCSRLRLTAEGKLRTCLFSKVEHDLRSLLRAGASDQEISARLQAIARQKESCHHLGQTGFVAPSRTMSRIGG